MKLENKIMKLKEETKTFSQQKLTEIMNAYDYQCDLSPKYRRDVKEILSIIPEEEHDVYLLAAIYKYSEPNIRFL